MIGGWHAVLCTPRMRSLPERGGCGGGRFCRSAATHRRAERGTLSCTCEIPCSGHRMRVAPTTYILPVLPWAVLLERPFAGRGGGNHHRLYGRHARACRAGCALRRPRQSDRLPAGRARPRRSLVLTSPMSVDKHAMLLSTADGYTSAGSRRGRFSRSTSTLSLTHKLAPAKHAPVWWFFGVSDTTFA